MQNRSPFLIAIDGRCAAGKTTFAENFLLLWNAA